MSVPILKYYRTHDNVLPPQKQTEEAACYDMHAHLIHGYQSRSVTLFTPNNSVIPDVKSHTKALPESSFTEHRICIPPRHRAIVPTGIIFDIPKGYSVRLHPRSGLSIKKGLIVANCEGIIDSDYFHEIKALMVNTSDEDLIIEHGDRICQAELVKCEQHVFEETMHEPEQRTDRVGGLGSTGVKV